LVVVGGLGHVHDELNKYVEGGCFDLFLGRITCRFRWQVP
jgi:hypothetical protein